MKVIDIYMQYFAADCVFNEIPRHAAVVKLTSTSDQGVITYEVSVGFFPFNDPEDFVISYDAFFSKILSQEKGRRTKKKDELYLSMVQETANELAQSVDGSIDWEKPLIPARYDK